MKRLACLPALAIASAVLALGASAPVAQAGCMTTLPASISLPRGPFAQAYNDGVVPVTVQSNLTMRHGVRVQIFTFHGQKLGEGFRRGDFTFVTVPVRMRFGVQQGRVTVIAISEPNLDRSCGPKHTAKVIGFRGCATQLPVSFTGVTQGRASDYGNFYSFSVSSVGGGLLRDITVGLYSFGGQTFGQTRIPALFGTVGVNLRLTSQLVPGSYSIFAEGQVDQPKSCGPKNAKRIVTFK